VLQSTTVGLVARWLKIGEEPEPKSAEAAAAPA
jgi:hypothetical protein